MENFAEYILNELDLTSKMEITHYLSKKTNIFFDKSIVLKTEILRLFLNYSKIEMDNNFLLTVCLLCNCKKVDNAQDIERIHNFAKDGANYLREMGFDKKFTKVCEEINRYSKSSPRERESDVLELVDHFGGLLLDRPERIGFKAEEALVLLEHRNLKGQYNRYLQTFIDFVYYMEQINMGELVNMTAFRRIVKIFNETESTVKFMKKITYEFQPKVDKLIKVRNKELTKEMFKEVEDSNRSLFSKETAKKIIGGMKETEKQTNEIY